MESDDSSPSIRIVEFSTDPQASEFLVTFAQTLRARGLGLLDATSSLAPATCDLTLAVIPDHTAGAPTLEKAAAYLEQGDYTVVPVVLGDATDTVSRQRSHLRVRTPDDQIAASKIELLARAGADRLVDLNGLLGRALRWEQAERSDRELLNSESATRFADLPALATVVLSERHELISQFVSASQTHAQGIARRNRRIWTTASVTLLIAVLVVVTARVAALRSAADFRHEAAVSDSARLVRIAAGLAGQDPDADLPQLLVNRALQLDPSKNAVDLARKILEQEPPHRSIRLSGTPVNVVAASNGSLLGITYQDGSVDLRDSAGKVEATLSGGQPAAPVPLAVSADGSHVATLGRSVHVVRPQTGPAIELPHDQSAWIGDWTGDRLDIVTAKGEYEIDQGHLSAIRAWRRPARLGTVTAADFSHDHALVALVDNRRLWIGSRTDGHTIYFKDRNDLVDIEFSPDSRRLYLVAKDGNNTALVIKDGQVVDEQDAPSNARIVPGHGTGMFALNSSGACPFAAGTSLTANCIHMHSGGSPRVAALPNGTVASVGADRFLRIWPRIETPVYPNPIMTAGDDLEVPMPAYRAASRSLLAVDPATSTATLFGQANGELTTANLPAMTERKSAFVKLPLSYQLTLSPHGRFMAQLWSNHLYIYDTASMRLAWESTTIRLAGFPVIGQGVALAVTDDGNSVVAANDFTMQVWKRANADLPFTAQTGGAPPAGFVDDGAGSYAAVDQGGMISVPGQALRSAPTGPTAAATSDGTVGSAYVSKQGKVVLVKGGEARTVTTLPPGFDAYAVRLSVKTSRMAVFGDTGVLVLDARTGDTLLRTYADRTATTVQDAAFVDTTHALILLRSGGLVNRRLLTDHDVVRQALASQPRTLTVSEIAEYTVPPMEPDDA